MSRFFMRFKKIKEVVFKIKILIIVLIILTVSGWGLVIYLISKEKPQALTCGERLERLYSYALLLDRSTELARQEKSFDGLEMDIHLLNNGSLLAEWQDVVLGGNQKEDLENYFDLIIDSLKFFSKQP